MKVHKVLLITIGLLLSVDVVAKINQEAIYSLGVNETGNPRLLWKEVSAGQPFVITRLYMGQLTQCADPNETQKYSSVENITKCKKTIGEGEHDKYSLTFTPETSTWRYTDKSIVVDEADAVEYKYSIRSAMDTEADEVSAWASSCAADNEIDPLINWVNNFNKRVAGGANWLKRSDIPNVMAGANADSGIKKEVTLSASNKLIVFANSKYVAVFTHRGTLVGLTHRALGEEFITYKPDVDAGGQAVTRDPFSLSNSWSWYLKYGKLNDSKENICTIANLESGGSISSLNKAPDVPVEVDNSGRLKFSWTLSGAFNGKVTTEWELSSWDDVSANITAGLKGKINMDGNLTAGSVVCAAFPQMIGLGLKGGGDNANTKIEFLLPSDQGGNANNYGSIVPGYPDKFNYSAITNNGKQLQMAGVMKNGRALLISTNDKKNHPVRYSFGNYWGSSGAINPSDSYIEHYAKDSSAGAGAGLLNSDYSVALRPMCGGWQRLGKSYRNWALEQPWIKNGFDITGVVHFNKKTIARSDIDNSLKHGLFWWLSWMNKDPSEFFVDDIQDKYKRAIGNTESGGKIPIGIHLYGWYQEDFDYFIPRFTKKSSAADAIRDIQLQKKTESNQTPPADSTIVIPYINVNGIDITNRSTNSYGCDVKDHGWYQKTFIGIDDEDSAFNGWDLMDLAMQKSVNNSDEKYYGTCYGKNSLKPDHKLVIVADPSQPRWQSLVSHNTSKVLSINANGVYYDTYGVGYHPDFALSHGHGGHGDWWLNGQLNLGKAARAQLSEGGMGSKILAAEYFNEGLMANTDIILNHSTPKLNDTPLIQTVYSGYQLQAGSTVNYRLPGELKLSEMARRAIWGRSFVWGSQLGLSDFKYLCMSTNCPDIEYLKSLAIARNKYSINKFLAFGELISLADDLNPQNLISYEGDDRWCEGANCQGSAPKVRGGRWRDPYGTNEIIVLTNTSKDQVQASIKIPSKWQGVEICTIDNQCVDSAASGITQVEMPPNGIKILASKLIVGIEIAKTSTILIQNNEDDGWEFNDSGEIYRPDGFSPYANDGGNYFGTWDRPNHYGAALRFHVSVEDKKSAQLISARLRLFRNGQPATGFPKVAVHAYRDLNCQAFSNSNLPYRDGVELTVSSTYLQFPNEHLGVTNEWVDIDVTNVMMELMGLPSWDGNASSICFIGKNHQATGVHEFGFRDSKEGAGVAPRLILDFK